MVFMHIILHKLTRLLASFDIYYHYVMNYKKISVNDISKTSLTLVHLTTLPDLLLNSQKKKKIPVCRFLCAV